MRRLIFTLSLSLTLNSCYTVLRVNESATEADFAGRMEKSPVPSDKWQAYYQTNESWWDDAGLYTETEEPESDEEAPHNYGRRRSVNEPSGTPLVGMVYSSYTPEAASEPWTTTATPSCVTTTATSAQPAPVYPAPPSPQPNTAQTQTAREFGQRSTAKK